MLSGFNIDLAFKNLSEVRQDCVDPERMHCRIEDNQKLNDIIREIKRHDSSPEMLARINRAVIGTSDDGKMVEAMKPDTILGESDPTFKASGLPDLDRGKRMSQSEVLETLSARHGSGASS